MAILFTGAAHLRCRWHLEKQIKRKLLCRLGKYYKPFWTMLKEMMYCASCGYFTLKASLFAWMADLYRRLGTPKIEFAMKYIQELVTTLGESFCEYYVQVHVTFGMRSSQRSESTNSSVKQRVNTFAYLGSTFIAVGKVQSEQAETLITGVERQLTEYRASSPGSHWYNRIVRSEADRIGVQLRLSGVYGDQHPYKCKVIVDWTVSTQFILPDGTPKIVLYMDVQSTTPGEPTNVQPARVTITADNNGNRTNMSGTCGCGDGVGFSSFCRHTACAFLEINCLNDPNIIRSIDPRFYLTTVQVLADRVWSEIQSQGPLKRVDRRKAHQVEGELTEGPLMADRQSKLARGLGSAVGELGVKLNPDQFGDFTRAMQETMALFTCLRVDEDDDLEMGEVDGQSDHSDDAAVNEGSQMIGSFRGGLSKSGPGRASSVVKNPSLRQKKGTPKRKRAKGGDEIAQSNFKEKPKSKSGVESLVEVESASNDEDMDDDDEDSDNRVGRPPHARKGV